MSSVRHVAELCGPVLRRTAAAAPPVPAALQLRGSRTIFARPYDVSVVGVLGVEPLLQFAVRKRSRDRASKSAWLVARSVSPTPLIMLPEISGINASCSGLGT